MAQLLGSRAHRMKGPEGTEKARHEVWTDSQDASPIPQAATTITVHTPS
jgi:hypothetical protein